MLVRAASLNDLKEDSILGVELGERFVALMLIEEKVYATDDVCSHRQCRFSEYGMTTGLELECACHGGSFLIPTGEVMQLPPTEPIEVFRTEVRDGEVFVELPVANQ
jgi:nitrite reductase/ring-hydroxylating ferredoxin subunit